MKTILHHSATPIWFLLMLATGLSWWVGIDSHSDGGGQKLANDQLISAALIVIAFIKVRFVISYFMEVRMAPLVLRLICDAWIITVCFAIIWLF